MSSVAALDHPAPETSGTRWSANPIVEWLLTEGWDLPCPRELVGNLGKRLVEMGIPVYRIRVNIRTLHPQFIGTVYAWRKDSGEVDELKPTHDILLEERYLKSPYAAIFQGAGGMRRRLDIPGVTLDFPVLEELRDEGATDYVAVPLVFSDGRIHAVTIASDRPGGFSTNELQTFYEMLPIMARLFEVHAMRRTSRTILDTYLGAFTGERVLNGQIRRGDGEDIHAVIWFCDLRGSTALADRMPRPDYLALLNSFFECMAGAILAHGGEVLTFLGDAVVGIFPIGAIAKRPELCPQHTGACTKALEAAEDAMIRMETLNRDREARGERPLGYGIGLHVGDAMYGNIGVSERLDFTVIGAAVNETARLEGMCKTLHKPIVISAELARLLPEKMVSLGVQGLRGVSEPLEVYTLQGM